MHLTPDEKFDLKGKVLAWCDHQIKIPVVDRIAKEKVKRLQRTKQTWNGTYVADLGLLYHGREEDFLKSLGVSEVVPFDAGDEEEVDTLFDFVATEIERYIEAKTVMDGHFSVYATDVGICLRYSEDVPEYV